MSDLKIYHHHIPKTAGATVKDLLENQIKEQLNLKQHNRPGLDDAWREILPGHEKEYDYYCWHLAAQPYLFMPKIISFTAIRNPVARIVSNFFWGKSWLTQAYGITDTWELFRIYITEPEFNRTTKDFQARYLVNDIEREKIIYAPLDKENDLKMKELKHDIQRNQFWINGELITRSWLVNNDPYTFEAAKDRLNKMVVVGLSEDINKFVLDLISYFNKNHSVNFEHIDLATKSNVQDESKTFFNELPKHIYDYLVEKNQVDYQLWEYVKSLN